MNEQTETPKPVRCSALLGDASDGIGMVIIEEGCPRSTEREQSDSSLVRSFDSRAAKWNKHAPKRRQVKDANVPKPRNENSGTRRKASHLTGSHGQKCDVVCSSPNDPSSATASAARVERTVRSQLPATLERTAQRPFAAAHG